MEKLKLLLIACLLGISFNSWSQSGQVSGVVLDETNAPLPGASVIIKGTNTGASTDFDGEFTITVEDQSAILVISYIGFLTKEIPLNGSLTYRVVLEPDSTGLDEVVLIGYGSVSKKDLTGAVASISAETLTEQRKTDIGTSLQGRVSGVDIRTLSSKPGAPLSIQIRGNTVITANQGNERDGVSDNVLDDPDQPLYVVDGIFFNDITILNPADIKQIDILKDASATAIYGARGANGVVIITTKNGIEGKTKFTYDTSFGLRSTTNVPDFFDGPGYVGFVDDVLRARAWEGIPGGTVADYNNIVIDRTTEFQNSNGNEEVDNVANGRYTDWIDLLQRTGIQTSHTVGVSGGSDGLVFNGSLGYLEDEGVLGIEQFERYNISASISKKVTDKFTTGIKTYLSFSEREEGSRELFRSSFRLAPTVNPFDSNGEIIRFPDEQDLRFPNPLFEDEGAWTINTKSLNVIASVFLNYKPAEWLSLKTQFSPNISSSRFGEFRGLLTKSSRDDPSRIRSIFNTTFRTSYTWDNIADIDFNLKGNHNLKATLISSLFYDQNEGSLTQTRDFFTDAFSFFNTEGGAEIREFGSFYEKETSASFAARLNYDIKNKYLLTATGRYDGSSKLAEGNKWKFFPSVAFAWKISEESFLQDTDWLNNLKLRLSYGESGNANTVDPYSSLAFLTQSNNLFGDDSGLGRIVESLPNADLEWEVSEEYNVGLDLSILDRRITLGFEYYNKTTEGSILGLRQPFVVGIGVPSINGASVAIGNFGSVRNEGVEITLNTLNVKTENFSWRTSLNYSNNDNEILELVNGLEQIPVGTDSRLNSIIQVGAPVDATYDFAVDGIWQIDETAEAASFGAIPGQYKFVDQNGDGAITAEDDKVVLGSQSPDWIGGMTNTFVYKNLELNVQVITRQGIFGHSEFHQNFSTFQGDEAVFNSLVQDYWTPNNPDAKYPSPSYGEDGSRPWFYEDMSFTKISNIGLAYTFPQDALDKLKLSNLRLSLDIQNPFTFTDFDGPDPETGLQNSFNMGYSLKTFLFGLKLTY